jgi:hypothetical protein
MIKTFDAKIALDPKQIVYQSGYKYQLRESYCCAVQIFPEQDIVTEFISLSTAGRLEIKSGYAWDGPSGPTIDTKDFMRGSLVHDALYQLMREGWLDYSVWRAPADLELKRICREDGMNTVRAFFVHRAVSRHGERCADPRSIKPLITAP